VISCSSPSVGGSWLGAQGFNFIAVGF
jgi:hypothetical protein